MARITGRIEFLVNGQLQYTKTGTTTLSGVGLSGEPGNFEMNEVLGDNGIHGFIENPVVAMAETTITDTDAVMIDTLARIRENGTIIIRTANGGKVYTMNGATCKRNLTITSGEGETTLTYVGNSWVESTEAAV
jgi:hypothetical protein